MNEVNNEYIAKALNELVPTIGIKEFIDHKKLVSLIKDKKVKEAIKIIALYLGLPIEVKISYVPNGYRPVSNDGFQSTHFSNDGFQSTHLVKTDIHNKGVGGITAQVSIPSTLPFYNTPGMINFPINIKLSENCSENPETLITVMAHELSHIVLHSLWHREKDNEFYTDLTAMILGFAKVMKIGRKVIKTDSFTSQGFLSSTTTTHTETTTYGYLSDSNFSFALNKIKKGLSKQKSEKNRLVSKLKRYKKQLDKTKKLSFYFDKYLENLDKNFNQNISQSDGLKISSFHQPGYTDNFLSVINNSDIKFSKYLSYVETINNYTEQRITTMQEYEKQLKISISELEKQQSMLKKDINVLKKYTSLIFKLKLMFA